MYPPSQFRSPNFIGAEARAAALRGCASGDAVAKDRSSITCAVHGNAIAPISNSPHNDRKGRACVAKDPFHRGATLLGKRTVERTTIGKSVLRARASSQGAGIALAENDEVSDGGGNRRPNRKSVRPPPFAPLKS